jgi:glycerophosphoryl diester phosphodiesterase
MRKICIFDIMKQKQLLPLSEISNSNCIYVAAHRGNSGEFPDNSIAAFRSAIEVGADMIELDVQYTKDGKIVVSHDNNIFDKKSNSKISFCDVDYQEIKNIAQNNSLSASLLSDCLKEFQNQIYAIIEMKPFFNENNINVLIKIVDILKDFSFSQNVVIASFDIENIKFIKQNNPTILTAAILNPNNIILPSELKTLCNCDAIICSIEELSKDIASNAQANNIFIGIYGVVSKKDVEKCIDLGCKVIGTNYPEKIQQFLKNN